MHAQPSSPHRRAGIIPQLGVDTPELRRARALWHANRFDEALELFEQAARKYPQNLVALIDGSRALGARFEISRAEALVDRLAGLAARDPQLLHLAGQSYRMMFRPEKAIACFERVLAMTRRIPDALLELAVLYERRHRLDEARQLVEDCLRADPDYWEADLLRGRILRRLKDPAANGIFRKLARLEAADPLLRAQAWTETAQQLDRDGDYDGAMAALLQGKELLRAREAPALHDSESQQRQLARLAAALTPEHWSRWAEAGRSFPLQRMAVLTGFPRSGTTLLEQVLDSHPELVSSDEREAFGRDIFSAIWRTERTPAPTVEALDQAPPERLRAQRQRYLDYMSAALNEPLGGRMHLDKNPMLTLLIPGMLRLFPETRWLIALRDPRDVVLSCFMQYLPLNANSVCFLTLERAARRYELDLSVWRRFREIARTAWLEVRYEDCVSDLEGQARRALEFLGLPWDARVLQYRERLRAKAVASPTYEAVSQPLYSSAIGRWKKYRKHLEPVFEVLAPSIQAFGYESS